MPTDLDVGKKPGDKLEEGASKASMGECIHVGLKKSLSWGRGTVKIVDEILLQAAFIIQAAFARDSFSLPNGHSRPPWDRTR